MGAQAFALALNENRTLSHLFVASNFIGDLGAEALGQAFAQRQHPQSLGHPIVPFDSFWDQGPGRGPKGEPRLVHRTTFVSTETLASAESLDPSWTSGKRVGLDVVCCNAAGKLHPPVQ